MQNLLLDAARRYVQAHAGRDGVAATPIAGLQLICATRPSALLHAINKPMVALVVQGSKRVAMGPHTYEFGAGQSLLITADVPTVSQITRASLQEPYISCVVELDLALIESLVAEIGASPFAAGEALRVAPTEEEVAGTMLRLLRLLDRPASLPVLLAQSLRELHFWLLSGRHGGAIRSLGVADSYSRRVARAVALVRRDFAKSLRVEQLAAVAGMSLSSFHEHFRTVTSLTPLQFQKQLRLIEARRLMLADGTAISSAAQAVGYESVPQFTREYGRLFGQPPARDMKATRARLQSAA